MRLEDSLLKRELLKDQNQPSGVYRLPACPRKHPPEVKRQRVSVLLWGEFPEPLALGTGFCFLVSVFLNRFLVCKTVRKNA